MQRKFSLLAIFVFVVSVGCFSVETCRAQDGGGNTGGNTGGDTGGNGGGLDLGNGANGGFNGLDLGQNAFGLQNDISVEPSLRFETGFVGPTALDLDGQGSGDRSSGHVGQRIEGDFGGGSNNSLTLGSTTNAGQGGRGGGGAAGGSSLFFSVPRMGIRARMARPRFITSAVLHSPTFAAQFVSRLDRIPATRELGKQYRIDVANKTATLTGTVGSVKESQMIERQLRLEPGVYRIVNRLQIRQ